MVDRDRVATYAPDRVIVRAVVAAAVLGSIALGAAADGPEVGRLGVPTPKASSRVGARRAAIRAALTKPTPVLPLTSGLDARQSVAQDIALADAAVVARLRERELGKPRLVEVFGVVPLRDSDRTPQTAGCQANACHRVELFDYTRNATLRVVVDVERRRVVHVDELRHLQPDVPEHLAALARDIAANAPEVHAALGRAPREAEALMASTKTALNRTRCERSRHLCVAPTFVDGPRALWAIVDLTDLRLVGVRWTDVGTQAAPPVTERRLQDDVITASYCEQATRLERDGWSMDYQLTGSDGLQVSNVSFRGRPVLTSAKLVDWHVSYSGTDGFGYSDAVGCPFFSQAAVLAVEPPRVEELAEGFALEQMFWSEGWPAACNYSYRQRYVFHRDGRFRVGVASIGRGCGNTGTYRPVTRIAFAPTWATFAAWSGSSWAPWREEGWEHDAASTPTSANGARYRVSDAEGHGWTMAPGRGKFGDGGRGDDAFVFVTRHHADRDEGDSELPTIGPCCNADHRQGPERFMEPQREPLGEGGVVVWYVAQLRNDDTPGRQYCWAESVVTDGVVQTKEYPCHSGPWFIPTTSP